MSEFPDIGAYAFLSDCETNALVLPSGHVEWMCVPRPDSASIFGALLDRSAGQFGFGPAGVEVPSQRRYAPGTMVLETTWHTPAGWLVVNDALVVGPWQGQELGLSLHLGARFGVHAARAAPPGLDGDGG